MTWLTFIVEMTKALAWPATLIGALVFFRRMIPNLIDRIRSLKYGDFEAAFTERSIRIAENIAEAKPLPRLAIATDSMEARLVELARQSPRAAIIEAWSRIEQRLKEMALADGADHKHNISQMLQSLRASSLVAPETEHALRGLQQLRNLAVHAPEQELSAQKAVDFVTLAGALLWTLESKPK
jgi:hypothetical protein